MKTAVEFIIESVMSRGIYTTEMLEEFEQAKEMEKEQIIKSCNDSIKICGMGHVFIEYAEQYYNETFKSE